MTGKNAIVVMLKSPEAGAVKTRLTPPIPFEDAAGLYRCFIEDTFMRIAGIGATDVYAAFTPANAEADIKGLIPPDVRLMRQDGDDLGARLSNVFERLFDSGHPRVVVIGSDSPDIPAAYVEDAFAELCGAGQRIVIGPARDGGYYLVGMNGFTPAPFTGVPWSTASVLEATLDLARSHSIAVTLLRRWHDIDEPDDLMQLIDNPNAPASARYMRDRGLIRLLKRS
ncbi:MAG: TIGR04282 family arsenosugar biosynthesis glycosyltransferase [Deltaproteobacteria bacterium]|nr:TIGR04282 family arsenosugar biosynthesis glycosyltransferase [Deltaproteobacteria bacterium]